MSNHRLSKNGQRVDDHDRLRDRAIAMLNSTVTLRAMNFPLDVEGVYNGCWTWEEQTALTTAKDMGIYIPHYNFMTVQVPVEAGIVELKIESSERDRFPSMDKKPWLYPDRLGFKEEAFLNWLTPLVTWHRKIEVASKLVRQFMNLEGYCGGSLASIRSRWPEFLVVPLSMDGLWPERVRDLGKVQRGHYDWVRGSKGYDWYLTNMDKLEIVGGILAGAQMHGMVEDNGPVTASSAKL